MSEISKKKYGFWKIAGGIFLAFIILGNLYQSFKPTFASMAAEWPLREYNDEIAECMETKTDKYECAIDVAVTFYYSDPEKAIQLCMIHNPVFDIRLGREYSVTNVDDLYAQKEENIARTACQISIERSLEPNPAPSELETEAEAESSDTSADSTTQTFTNEKYGYSVTLLNTDIVTSNQFRTEASNAFNIYISDKDENFLASITVLDPEMYSGEYESLELPLAEYVEHIAELNEENLSVDVLESRPIGGISGYTISLINAFSDDMGGRLFDDPIKAHSFIFLEHKGLIYQFEMPETMGHRGREIIYSLEFL